MENFRKLIWDLDQSNSTNKKIDLINSFFSHNSHQDNAWVVFLLIGEKIKIKNSRTQMQEFFAEYSKLPIWLIKESQYHVGDSAETLSLLRGPKKGIKKYESLDVFIQEEILPLKKMDKDQQKNHFFSWWDQLDEKTLFIAHKMLTGGFRIGVSKLNVIKALESFSGVEADILSFRMMGSFEPSEESFKHLISHEVSHELISQAYPFYLASPLEDEEEIQNNFSSWCIEWKWDGIRAQMVKRQGEVFIWSRGEELVNESFPDLVEMGKQLPDGTVIDGELLPFKERKVLSFNELQKRLNKKKVSKKDLSDIPVTLMMYDLLEWERKDIRSLSLKERKSILNQISIFPQSEILSFHHFKEAQDERQKSRDLGVEGFMLKHWDSPYLSGRKRGSWWKWKIDPMTLDCVLLYAQSGSGRRSNLYTDYTLGVWKGEELVPITKAYSGLTDEELASMDAWIKKNTLQKFGPVRSVKLKHVFEIAFEGIQISSRHKAGYALRFPRISRWRKDKKPEDANHLEDIKDLL